MSRKPAAFTQIDLVRAIRAAEREGWHVVRVITPGGAMIEIERNPPERSWRRRTKNL